MNNIIPETTILIDILSHFGLHIFVLFVLIRWLYYTSNYRKDYSFTYFLIGIMVFFLCYFLENIKLQLGFAFGLFAIFSIIRYRTSQIPIKEMTYLFLIIGVSVLNALSRNNYTLFEIAFANGFIVLITIMLEKIWQLPHLSQKIIIYDNITNIRPEKHPLLIKELKTKTGLPIKRIEIGKIDFLKETANITIYYLEKNSFNLTDNTNNVNQNNYPED